ncbi:DUF418 domain-containing protein (plasmid) [Bacillus sp. S3]|uniref:DUF418 domain-containing protein n=1 Tax=Bacillus sp. S3 TaxID=486398 RepID=UPI001188F6F4|nr:DUF418 domain-containing protein [Bacillus sp. S3]QCJ45421.1 DUF418 domain-containing protein [Bacillus sp. S3]
MNSRIHIIDSIRGLAILGIILVNIPSFAWPEIYDSFPSSYWHTPAEKLLHDILSLLVQSSFYPVFATLFGVSMLFVFQSAEKKGLNQYFVFLKRLIILLIIGLAHALFIWHGDILVVYALLGLLLLPFYRLSAKLLFKIGLTLWLVPNAFYGLWLFVTKAVIIPYDNTSAIQEVIKQYHSGILAAFNQNIHEWSQLYSLASLPFIFISIFPMLLFGLSLAKSNLLSVIAENRLNVNLVLIGSGVIGLSLKALPLIGPSNMLFSHLAEVFGGPIVGLFYALLMVKFANKLAQFQTALSYVGRMSLSNYVFQSLTGFLIFKVLGLYGKISTIHTITIALIIISMQLIISKWWIKKFNCGPLENMWKKLTYFHLSNTRVKEIS